MSRTRHASPFNRKLILPMILGSILNPINSSIISVALLPIGQAFGAPPSQTAWLISSLYLATSIGQPVIGKLIDNFGPRLLFILATSLVGVASLIASVAPNFWWLVAARVVLGFGTCAGYPASMYLIRSEAERTGEERSAGILTTLAISNQTIAVIGPSLGGLLIQFGGWQSIFVLNIPLSLACVLLGYSRFPKRSPGSDGEKRRTKISLDLTGIVCFSLALTSLLLFLMNPHWDKFYLVVIAIAAGAVFAIVELKVKDPFINLRVLSGNAPLLLTYARSLLYAVVTYCFLYGYPQWLEQGRGQAPSSVGLLLLPLFLTAIVVSRSTGKSPAIRLKLIVGAVFQFVAVLLLFFINSSSSLVFLIAIVLLLGIPQGLLTLANQNAVYYQADPGDIGASSGLLRTFMYLGAILASAANGLFLNAQVTSAGMHHIALFCGGIGIMLIALTLIDPSLGKVGSNTDNKAASHESD